MKYTWELAVYFSFYVLPFINDFFTDLKFLPHFLPRFARLGPVNKTLQMLINGYYHWKKNERMPQTDRTFFDFYEILPLRNAETLFYRIGISREEAGMILEKQLMVVIEYAKFIVAHITARVVDDPAVVTNRAFIEGIDLANAAFNEHQMRARWAACPKGGEPYQWILDPCVFDRFQTALRPELMLAAGD